MIAVESVGHPDRQMSNKLDAFKKLDSRLLCNVRDGASRLVKEYPL